MRTHIPAQPDLAQKSLPCRSSLYPAAILAAFILLIAGTLHATTQSSTPQAAPHKSAQTHKRASAAKQPAPALPPSQPVVPPAPKPPEWPANDKPVDAKVVWNSQGLRIDAANSSLAQILTEVSTVIGTKVEGLGADQRVFGAYGPGMPREVLAQLLDGSGYNVLMIGDQGQGTPRSIVLSAKNKGDVPEVANNEPQPSDESADADDPQQPTPLQPQPPGIRNGFAPGSPPRTPQQIMQEMQQRQLQQTQQGQPPQ